MGSTPATAALDGLTLGVSRVSSVTASPGDSATVSLQRIHAYTGQWSASPMGRPALTVSAGMNHVKVVGDLPASTSPATAGFGHRSCEGQADALSVPS